MAKMSEVHLKPTLLNENAPKMGPKHWPTPMQALKMPEDWLLMAISWDLP